jgi:hypothetical protein
MATFDCKTFTERVFKRYAEDLRAHIPRVRFLREDDPAVAVAKDVKRLRYLGQFTPLGTDFELDNHMRSDGSLKNEEELAYGVASALSEPLITAAQAELQPEADDPSKRVGAGQLWVVHRSTPPVLTLGAAQVHIAGGDGIELYGQSWYDRDALKSRFLAKAEWALARVGQVKKEARDINSLRE